VLRPVPVAGTSGIACAVLFMVALSALAAPAGAQVTVALEGCGELGGLEVTRALELELEGAATAPLSVRLACDAAGLLIEVDDPVTDKQLVRRVPGLEARRAVAARTVALLVSELVLASWAELLLAPPAASDPPERARALDRVERALRDERAPESRAMEAEVAIPDRSGEGLVLPPEPVRAPALSVPVRPRLADPDAAPLPAPATSRDEDLDLATDLGGGVLVRDLAAPFVTWHLSLQTLALLAPGIQLGARVAVELGDAQRSAGAVSFAAVSAGLVGRITAIEEGGFSLGVLAELRGAWVRLDGRPARSSVEGRALDDALLEVAIAAQPSLRLGPVHLGVSLLVGACVVGPTGTVAGEADLVLPGVFAGGGLLVGLR